MEELLNKIRELKLNNQISQGTVIGNYPNEKITNEKEFWRNLGRKIDLENDDVINDNILKNCFSQLDQRIPIDLTQMYYLKEDNNRKIIQCENLITLGKIEKEYLKRSVFLSQCLSEKFIKEFKDTPENIIDNCKGVKYFSEINSNSFDFSKESLRSFISDNGGWEDCLIKDNYLYSYVPIYLLEGIYLIGDSISIISGYSNTYKISEKSFNVIGIEGEEDKIIGYKYSLKGLFKNRKILINLYRSKNFSKTLSRLDKHVKLALCRSKYEDIILDNRISFLRCLHSTEVEIVKINNFKFL